MTWSFSWYPWKSCHGPQGRAPEDPVPFLPEQMTTPTAPRAEPRLCWSVAVSRDVHSGLPSPWAGAAKVHRLLQDQGQGVPKREGGFPTLPGRQAILKSNRPRVPALSSLLCTSRPGGYGGRGGGHSLGQESHVESLTEVPPEAGKSRAPALA